MPRPWSPGAAQSVCDAFVARAGLTGVRPELISFRQNAIFHLAGHDLSLRVYGPWEDPSRATLMVNCARWLEARNLPAVRLSPSVTAQPFDLLGYQASVWRWIAHDRQDPDAPFRHGRLMRRFHALDAGAAFAVPPFDPLIKIRRRLDRLSAGNIVPPDARAVLEGVYTRAAALEPALHRTKLGHGLLHGDASPGNVIQSGGEMIMIDLDSVCFGPREWDLVPTAIISRRFDQDGQARWRAFLDGYGIGETDWPELHAASLIKQLSMTVYLCLSAGQSPGIDAEIGRRLRTWMDWDFDGRWTTGFTAGTPG